MGGAKRQMEEEAAAEERRLMMLELVHGHYLDEDEHVRIAQAVIDGGLESLSAADRRTYDDELAPYYQCEEGHTTKAHPCPRCESDNEVAVAELESE